jgi:hypothetical protein
MTKNVTFTAGLEGSRVETKSKAGFWSRIAEAMTKSRQKSAEREIARFIELSGGQLTDNVEREISRRFGGPAGRA